MSPRHRVPAMHEPRALRGLAPDCAWDADVTDALVRLAARTVLPAQLHGATARPASAHRIARANCHSCVAARLSGRRPLQLEWVSVRVAQLLDPAWAVMLFVFDADDSTPLAVETLLHVFEEDLCDAPFAQWVAAIDALDPREAQRAIDGWNR